MYSDAENAALYDAMFPWDPTSWAMDAFASGFVAEAESVLDVGCGTGSMLHYARASGHSGRLVGLDPDPHMLARARRRTDIVWVAGTAVDGRWQREFALATMTNNAFQCLVTDDELDASLTAIRNALSEGGRFVFDSRHPRARAWDSWIPSNVEDVTDASGRALKVWHQVESVAGELVTFTENIADPDGTVLRVDRATLRFLDVPALNAFLTEAGLEIEAQYGDFRRGPITEESKVIVTVARRSG